MKQTILDINDIQDIIPALRSKNGEKTIKWLMRVCDLDRINGLYGRNCEKRGADFVDSILNDLGITLRIDNENILHRLPEGAFITVSNHPFGALDGVILIKMLAQQRPDFKVMVNWILNYIQAMSDNFIAVDPISNPDKRSVSMAGIREALKQVRDGHPIGFFPAGAVSKWNHKLQLCDRQWQPNIIRLIQQMKIPVIPIYFHGSNSVMFNILSLISWKLRTFLLPMEVYKKENSEMHISIGEPISWERQKEYKSVEELGSFLKAETYKMRKLK